MLYFIVLPVFLVWLVCAGASVALCRRVEALQPAYPFAWRMALWSTVGFLAANALLILALLLGLDAAQRVPASAGQVLGNLSAVGALVGPPLASGAGWLVGLVVGVVLALRRRRVAPNNSFKPNSLRESA